MPSIRHGSVALLLVVSALYAAPLGKEEKDLIKAQLRASVYALEREDADTIINFTPDAVVEMAGGSERMKEDLQAALRQFRGASVKIGSFEVGDDFQFFEGTKHEFFVVRTRMVMITPKNDIETSGFMLGVRGKATKRWKYVDGAKLTADTVKALFPDIPAFVFPELKQQFLQK